MGGRAGGSGRGGGGKDTFDHSLDAYSATVMDLLQAHSPRGKPFSIDDALKLANPNYWDDSSYRNNCQRCVWAFELLRRGFSVEAMASGTSRYSGALYSIDEMYMSARNATRDNYINPMAAAGITFSDYGDGKTADRVAREYAVIEAKMKEWGEGSRAFLSNTWDYDVRNGGHIWNVELINGEVVYLDAQINGKPSVADRNSRTFDFDRLYRVDNLAIPEDILNAVMPALRKSKKKGK